MKIGKLLRAAIIAATLGVVHAGAVHADLLVDFGNGTSPVQGGYEEFTYSNGAGFNGIFQVFAGTGLDNGSDIRVALGTTGTDITRQRSVDRTSASSLGGGLNDLLRDWIGMDQRGGDNDLSLSISNLAAGNYLIRSYHTDIGSVAGQGNQQGQLDILVNDGKIIDDFQILGENATPNTATSPNFIDYVVASDGVNPVSLTYLTNSAISDQAFTVFNGFEITATSAPVTPVIPPPSLFQIDIDTTHGGTAINTQTGWTSLNVDTSVDVTGNGSSVDVEGTAFTVFSADSARNRTTPNDLTRDFIFDDGPSAAVGLTIDDLPPGEWMAEVWAHDSGTDGVGDMIVGLIEGPLGSPETIVATNAVESPTDPIHAFTFIADGFSQYHIFTRENNDQGTTGGRTRFNALRLTLIPEPASFLMFGAAGLLAVRRRRHG